jgi:uncharacterized membrane protein
LASLGRLPSDLTTVVLVTLLVNASIFVPFLRGTPLQTVLGLLFVIAVPGYALVSALFPEADQSRFRTGDDSYARGATDRWDISGVERATLSLGSSIAIDPLVGIEVGSTRVTERFVIVDVRLQS